MTLTFTTGGAGHGFDVSMALQIATFLVAAIGPLLAYRYARKLSNSANRQAWLESLRLDVASLVALADAVAVIRLQQKRTQDEKAKQDGAHLYRDKATELQTLRYRIRLRLRASNLNHAKLIEAIDKLCGASTGTVDERDTLRNEVVTLAEGIFLQVWRRIEKGE